MVLSTTQPPRKPDGAKPRSYLWGAVILPFWKVDNGTHTIEMLILVAGSVYQVGSTHLGLQKGKAL